MTEPTDAELTTILRAHWPAETNDWASHMDFARAVLAKWGQPAQAAEPVAYLTRNAEGDPAMLFFDKDEASTYCEDGVDPEPLFTPHQPTQAQAGAVPLTCEWTHDENDGFWESACGEAWQFNDGGPADNNVRFCQGCGKPLGIKGGQHGDAKP